MASVERGESGESEVGEVAMTLPLRVRRRGARVSGRDNSRVVFRAVQRRRLVYARWPVEGGATKVRLVWFVCGGAATSSVTKKDDGRLAEAITVEWRVVEGTTGPGPGPGPKLELSSRATGLATGDNQLPPLSPSEGAAWPLLAGRLPPQHVRDRCRAGAIPKPVHQ